ncbi:hypothetical protein AVEN_132528-1 [Araneus ventricosus]|uniref:Uncharacterized protein n=1 Tax=Araneus ventricosus TaxID=182803 RepID=A0A4Y2UGE5_ARAVE|nr:hypothetical protein AVEN_214770-1 [Araneus ventricosus]GBO11161.1 hypothetical protein AVEN_132528-1 [Araneus ventricosus]
MALFATITWNLRLGAEELLFVFFHLLQPGAIPSLQLSTLDHLGLGRFQVIGLSNQRHEIYEYFGKVERVAQLACGVVPWEDVVVVVPTFSVTEEGNESIFSRFNILIVRLVAIFVGSAVHQPREVQAEAVSRHACYEERVPHSFAPTPDGDHSWQDEAEENGHRNVEPGK